MYALSISNVSLTNVSALEFGAKMFRIKSSSWWVFPLMNMECLSPSFLIIFGGSYFIGY